MFLRRYLESLLTTDKPIRQCKENNKSQDRSAPIQVCHRCWQSWWEWEEDDDKDTVDDCE